MSGRIDAALIIGADSDLAPAVRAARHISPELFLAAALPPKRYSAELGKLMPPSFHINNVKIRGSQLPNVVRDGSRRAYARPAKWT